MDGAIVDVLLDSNTSPVRGIRACDTSFGDRVVCAFLREAKDLLVLGVINPPKKANIGDTWNVQRSSSNTLVAQHSSRGGSGIPLQVLGSATGAATNTVPVVRRANLKNYNTETSEQSYLEVDAIKGIPGYALNLVSGHSNPGVLGLSYDTSGCFVRSKDTYNRTYSSAANMVITATGTIGRSTSARKYKLDIRHAPIDPNLLLRLTPRSWIDKGQHSRTLASLADATVHSKDGFDESPKDYFARMGWNESTLPRHYGLIAEEVEEAGGEAFVIYDEEGNPDGLAYDRIIVAAVSTAQHLQAQIEELRDEIAQLKMTVSS